MKKTITYFQKHVTGRRVAVLFVLTMAVYLAMLLFTIPSVLVKAPDMQLFDMSPTGYSPEYAFTLLEAIGSAGRHTYLTTQLPLDFIYPGLFAITYASLLIWLFGKGFERRSKIFFFALVPIAAGLFDYLENVGVIVMLNAFPNITDGVVDITSTFTILKSGFTIAFYILLVIGVIPLIKSKISVIRS